MANSKVTVGVVVVSKCKDLLLGPIIYVDADVQRPPKNFWQKIRTVLTDEAKRLGVKAHLVPTKQLSDKKYICDAYHHMNDLGRELQTKILVDSLLRHTEI